MPSFKYAQIEYERRFLLAQRPSDLPSEPFIIIEDVYIPDTRLRLRRMSSPSFARKEVTDDPRYTGGALVTAAPDTIAALLVAMKGLRFPC